ncbi:50S ribosomal protein L10 [Blattabacterium cuenoti]|uniref:50S ribosomal protein L10 n=1 Tax=Blattabacterium cuenoti TaxID=1653831 RepID=UPI001EEC30DC|nr:50S ribosomal protein L10 [Blattabacterium cuenoti]
MMNNKKKENKKKEKKEEEILELISIFSNNDIIYIVDIFNLSSNQISVLRKNFKRFNIIMRVVKNTLLKKSLEKIKNKNFNSFFPVLNGNTTILFSKLTKNGNIIPKIIKKFHIQEKIEKPYLKGAYVQESFYFGNKDLNLLIKIKSKEDLIADILCMLQFPMKNIISCFSNLTKYKIFGILESLSSNKKNSNFQI